MGLKSLYERIAALDPQQREMLARQLHGEESGRERLEIVPRRTADAQVAASPMQKRLWLLDQIEPGNPAYNLPVIAFELRGALDVAALGRALGEVERRHESLRTSFRRTAGEPVQVISPGHSVPMPVVDLSALGEEAGVVARQQAAAETDRRYELARGPLWWARLLKLSEQAHFFMVGMHHIISDAWSIGVFYRELAVLYHAFSRGEPSPLAELPFQYRDFSAWHHQRLSGELLERELDFWRQELADAEQELRLPLDRPRRELARRQGRRQDVVISEGLQRSVAALTETAGATLFMVLSAAFKGLLHRYSGQDDILLSFAAAGRHAPASEQLIGFFVNAVVLRTRFRADMSLLQLLQQVRGKILELYEHQELPFDQLVEDLEPNRDPARGPLYQVGLTLENTPTKPLDLPGLQMLQEEVAGTTSQIDLIVFVGVSGGLLQLIQIEYDTDLFDASTIQRLQSHFTAVLQAMAETPDRLLGECSLLSRAERHELIREHGGGTAPLPRMRLEELVMAWAERTPDAIAMIFSDLSEATETYLSYRQLDRQAGNLASYLQRSGSVVEKRAVEKRFVDQLAVEEPVAEEPIGLCLERSAEMVVAMLGILKAGGVYVPLDPSHPVERLDFMIADAGIRRLVTRHTLAERLGFDGVETVCLDRDRKAITAAGFPALGRQARTQALAYVMYTSGSTGKPKGVAVSHRAVTRLVLKTSYLTIASGDRVAQASTATFDASTFEIWGALLNGGCLIGIERSVLLEPGHLGETLQRYRVATLFLTTALFNQQARQNPRHFAGLHNLLFGGEASDPSAVRNVVGQPNRLLHVYGPTENTTFSTWHRVRDVSVDAVTTPIGRSITNTSAVVTDRRLRLAPFGVTGELCLGGSGLARSYFRQSALTAERFVPNPFSRDPGCRIYRTGDQVRMRQQGALEFVGRRDHQIKLRGFRIELGEIEVALAAHPDVSAAAVLLHGDSSMHSDSSMHGGTSIHVGTSIHRDPSEHGDSARHQTAGNRRLMAFVVLDEGVGRPTIDASGLRDFLRLRLPEVMIPASFQSLRELPLSPRGKVDRAALEAVAQKQTQVTDGGSDRSARFRTLAPAVLPPSQSLATDADSLTDEGDGESVLTPVEEVLAGVMAEALGLESVGRFDDFFDIGGDSLTAIQVIARVREVFAIELEVQMLFSTPSVAALAPVIEGKLWERASPGASARRPTAIRPVERNHNTALPLSFAQQRLWFLDRLLPANPFYNVPMGWIFRGQLDRRALARALGEIVRRHEALRTRFVSQQGSTEQIIVEDSSLVLPWIDLSALESSVLRAELTRLANAEALRPFVLSRGPMVRTALLDLGADETALLLTLHHIVSDGWSIGVLQHELMTLYDTFQRGNPSPLPALPIQYADFAVWQRQWLSGEVLQEQLDYWRQHLAGAPVLELPLDKPRPTAQVFRGSRELFYLSREVSHGLDALARRQGATLFMVLLAAVAGVLRRLTGQQDFVVGTPIANRNRTEIEGLIGFFVNTLALRCRTENPTFEGFLGQVREVALGAYAHQDLPFEKLVEDLQPDRDLGRNPLFQVLLVLQNVPLQTFGLAGLTAEPLPLFEARTTRVDLELHLWSGPEGIAGALVYDRELFDATTLRRLGEHLRGLLGDVVRDATCPLAQLSILSAGQRHQMLVELGGSVGEIPGGRLEQHFVAIARSRPDAAAALLPASVSAGEDAQGGGAVAGAERILTYGELDRRSSQLAQYLVQLGCGHEMPVGLFMERSPEMLVAMVGILKAGGAYVPLDTSYPAERLAFMIEEAALPLIVTEQRWADSLPWSAARAVELDREWLAITRQHRSPLDTPVHDGAPVEDDVPVEDGASLAYVMYTSGSTGSPKGVAVTHRAIVRLVVDTDYVSFPVGERVAQASTTTFDAATFEIWGALLNGGCLVGLDKQVLLSPARLVQELHNHAVGTMFLTPALFDQAMRETPEAFTGLRQLVLGGDVVDPARARDLLTSDAGGGFRGRLLNGYGPTENTTFSTWYEIRRVAPGASNVPIGNAIANSTALVVDRGFMLAPLGATGELCLGGHGLARGYLRRPRRTAGLFVPDPFSAQSGARLYRTGDLVRRPSDGALRFLGRRDHQIKLRGFRIELGEIEAVLSEHPGINQVAVLVMQDGPGKRLAACFTAVDPAPAALELRAFLSEQLPEYMLPAAFVPMASLPLNANGKLDRGALASAVADRESIVEQGATVRPSSTGDALASRSTLEELIAGLFEQLLAIEGVGAGDNFFELGGHSLLATQLISRVRRDFGLELPLKTVFEAPTVAGFARRVHQALRRSADDEVRLVPVERVGKDGAWTAPVSYGQQRLWFLDQLEPGSPTYNIPQALTLSGALDMAALRACFDEIVRRHEALRTTFRDRDGKPLQHIQAPVSLPLPLIDLRHLPPPVRRQQSVLLVQQQSLHAFDLASGPLIQGTLLRLAASEHVLILNLHHIVADGWSMNILVRELGTLYQAFSAGRRSPLPELPIQYADFTIWQRRWLADGVLEQQLNYWRDHLAGVPVLELPTDRPRPPVRTVKGRMLRIFWPGELKDSLRAVAQAESVTLFMVSLGGLQTLLYRITGQLDVAVGTAIANRNQASIEDLIGFFVNTLALRTSFAERPDGRSLLRQVREISLGAFGHQDVPFEQVVEKLQPERSLDHPPLFQVGFNMLNLGAEALALPGLEVSEMVVEAKTAKYDLSFSLRETEHGLAGSFEYRADLFDGTTIQRFGDHLRVLLTHLVADPDRPVAELPLLDLAEQHQILVEWNRGPAAVAVDNTPSRIDEGLFEHQASRWPDRVAVAVGSRSITYRALDRRANQLAQSLRRQHRVTTECRVGIFCERSPELVVAMLGVIKAGAALVPLEPSTPTERNALILEDAAVEVVLTQRHLQDDVPAVASEMIFVDSEGAGAEGDLSGRFDCRSPHHLAYIAYTSSSTGLPQGVMVCHRGLGNFLDFTAGGTAIDPGQRWLQTGSMAIGASVSEVFQALALGATLILPERSSQLAGSELAELLAETSVTQATLAPSTLASLGEVELPALELLLVGGEACSAELVARWAGGGQRPRRFINPYGCAEATATASLATCRPDGGEPRIGRPVAEVDLHVLDRNLYPAPMAVPGELHIGGAKLARGYWRRPRSTAANFVPNPFARHRGERLYKTGDLARHHADGELEFLGRWDHQVKIRGLRVELGEIEVALVNHPALTAAVVIARPGEARPGEARPGEAQPAVSQGVGDLTLVAYLVSEWERPPEDRELGFFLEEQLPSQMVPATFVYLDALPRTTDGKVDHKALPGAQHRGLAERPYVAPRSPAEELLVTIWAEHLGVEKVGIHDDFFDLGGHSLLATQLISKVRHNFGLNPHVQMVFEAPTVAQFAVRLQELFDSQDPAPPMVRRSPASHSAEALPLSFAQQRLWFLDRLAPGSSVYNIPLAFRLSGNLSAPALAAALGEIVSRHEALRTSFPAVDGHPSQVIHPHRRVDVPAIDLSELPDPVRRSTVQEHLEAEAGRPFDLATGPLMRGVLLTLSTTEHVLSLCFHHIVSDGWSMGPLLRELTALYRAALERRPSPLADLPVQYADYAIWQRQWLRDEVLDRQLAYWLERLTGAPALLELPTDRPRPAVQSDLGAHQHFYWPAELAAAANSACRSESVTLFMLGLASFQALLRHTTASEDFCIGSVIANRERPEIQELIGYFVNMLVLRADVSGSPSFRELLGRVRTAALGAYSHQDAPFEQVVDALEPERTMAYSPLFQVSFTTIDPAAAAIELPGLEVRPLEMPGSTARWDLSLSLSEGDDALGGMVIYRVDLFDRTTICRLLEQLRTLMTAAVADLERSILELPVLTRGQRQQALIEWHGQRVERAWRCLHDLFAEQAEARGESVAVIDNERFVSYAMLDSQAEQLALRLQQSHGIGLEDRVGILMRRSVETMVAMLAVMKAGAAYVPMDPELPRERLAFLIADAEVATVLTEEALAAKLSSEVDVVTSIPGAAGARPLDVASSTAILPEHLAYVLYTSGSTGTPKGGMVPHRGVVNLMRDLVTEHRVFAPRPGDRVCQLVSLSFDSSVWDIWKAWSCGATLVLAGRSPAFLGDRLLTLLHDQRVTHMTLPPTVLATLPPVELPNLAVLILGGEACPAGLIERWAQAGERRLFNFYGLTETSIGSTISECHPDGSRPLIGRPFTNMRALVLNERLEPLPATVVGELGLAGEGLGRGYLGRPGLTAAHFVPDPWAEDTVGMRLFRTGDRVRWSPEGRLDFLGRSDHQIKLRGLRIELGEIEAVLGESPAIDKVAVVARDDGASGDRRLVAFYEPVDSAEPPTFTALRSFLEQRLPTYMVPATFVGLDALPRNRSGKIDRAQLGRVELDSLSTVVEAPGSQELLAPDGRSTAGAPRDAVERELLRIWEEALSRSGIGVEHNFFELGGHSLLAVRLMAAIEESFGQELPIATLFQAPTVRDLAQIIRREPTSTAQLSSSPLVTLQSRGSGAPLFFIHPGGGSVMSYVPLVQALDSPRPVFGLQSPSLDGDAPLFQQLEAMAASYVDLITAHQPEGPYLLTGWSLGGVVAYEMARQLRAQGLEIAFLGLIDSHASEIAGDTAPEDAVLRLAFFSELIGVPIQSLSMSFEDFRRLSGDRQMAVLRELDNQDQQLPSLPRLKRLFEVFRANSHCLWSYGFAPYDGSVHLFRAATLPDHMPLPAAATEATLGWGELCSDRVVVTEVPGNHYTMLSPPAVKGLAESLRTALQRVEPD